LQPSFEDHHIIIANPIGWYNRDKQSTMNRPHSHEENADEVMELLSAIGIESTMVMGYS
jgi:hypothetical protein